MSESTEQLTEEKDILGGPRRVRTTDPDVFSDPESARIAARNLGCIGIRRYLNRSGGESWMPCSNESDFRKYRGIGVSGRRFRRQQLEREVRQITGRGKLAKKTIDTAIEFKSKNTQNYTKPELRERLKQRIMAGSKGGAPGQWSARKAQLLAQEYRRAGGGYRSGGKTKPQRSLTSWTKQKWTTSDGKRARRGNYTRRYLPAAAWSRLTPAQRAATNRKKIEGSKEGRQFVDNTDAAKRARKRSIRGQKHIDFDEAISVKIENGLIETKAAMRRWKRRALQTPGALKPRLNSMGRDLNPATARNADKDPYVLEGIPTINRGRGILDPTPGGKPARWVPRVSPASRVAETAKPKEPSRPKIERFPKAPEPVFKRPKLSWLPDDADKWTERDIRQLFNMHGSSGQSYNEFAKTHNLFVDDVREALEGHKKLRKTRLNNFKKRSPKLNNVVGRFGAVRAEALEAISDGKIRDWPSLVNWAFKDGELRRQRLNERAVNDLFNNVQNGIDPDGKSDIVLGFVPSKSKAGEKVKTFARAGNLPIGFEGRFKKPAETISAARSISSVPERAARRSQQRVNRISRPVQQTRASYARMNDFVGITGRMATPQGPDSSWTPREKSEWKAKEWRKRLLFDSIFNSLHLNASSALQQHLSAHPDKLTAARAIFDLNDSDLDTLFKSHWDALGNASLRPPAPKAADLPLLPSEVEAAATIKRPLLRAFLDEYSKMAPNGTLARLDVDALSNEDVEELFNRYILPEMVDPTRPTTLQAQDVAQKILQPGNDNSPLRLLDNVLFMAGDDAFTLEGKRRILEERLAAGQATGTLTPSAANNIQNQIDEIDDELQKLLDDAAAGRPLDATIPFTGGDEEPGDGRRKMPKWAAERPVITFEESPDEYIMFLLEHQNDELGDHPEYGLITYDEWQNWGQDIQDRQEKAYEVYMEGGDLAAEDAINALNAEIQQWEEIGRSSPPTRPPTQRWIPEDAEDEEQEIPQDVPMYDEFGIKDEDWVWNTEYGSPEELGVTDDPSTWANHPDNLDENGNLLPALELREFIESLNISRSNKDALLKWLEDSEWVDPHNSHIAQRYFPLIAELLDEFTSDTGGAFQMGGTQGVNLPNLGGAGGNETIGLDDHGGPRLKKNYPYLLRRINWDAAGRMFQRITERLGGPTKQKGSSATAAGSSPYMPGVYEDMSPQQLQNIFVEAAQQARELYLGQSRDSKNARKQMWDLLSAGQTADEIAQELIIFGVDQPSTDRPAVPLDIRNDIVKAAATQYAIENNIPTNQVSSLLNAADTAFAADQARQDALRQKQIEGLKDTLEAFFPGQTPRQIAASIPGLLYALEREKERADLEYRQGRGHAAILRMQLRDIADTFDPPTARRPLYLRSDGKTFTVDPNQGVPVFWDPNYGQYTTDASLGLPQAYDEGWDPTKDTRKRLLNRQNRWWERMWGYDDEIINPFTGEPTGQRRQYVGPLQQLLTSLQLHQRKYGAAGSAGVGGYILKSHNARIDQLQAVQRMLTDKNLRSDAQRFGISGFMRNAGPNLYEEKARKAARVLAGGRFRKRDASRLLDYDSDGFPVTRAMRRQYAGFAGKFADAADEFALANQLNPEKIDFFKHLSPEEQQYFREIYSNPQDIIAIPKTKPSVGSRRANRSVKTPDELFIDSFYAGMESNKGEISGSMGLKRSLRDAGGMSRRFPEAWQRRYLTARNSFRLLKPWAGKKAEYRLEQRELDDSIFGPRKGLYVVDVDTGNVMDGPFTSAEAALLAGSDPLLPRLTATEKATGAMRRIKSQGYPRPWEQMPEIAEAIAHGVGREFREFLTLDEHKLSDIRSTVYDTERGLVNERALSLDKGVPQKASDTAVFSRNPETGELMVLLIQRQFGPHRFDTGAWVLPGGFADPGESELETAIRELEEETGIQIPPDALKPGWWDGEGKDKFRVKQIGTIKAPDWDVRFTKGVEVGGTALFVSPDIAFAANDDAMKAQWISVNDIADGKVPIGFGHIAWIRHGLNLESDSFNNSLDDNLDSRLARLERATRARNKELMEISNSWRRIINRSRKKDEKAKLFDEKNLGGYGTWELIPSDDMVEVGVRARRALFGRSMDPDDITSEVQRIAPSRRDDTPTNFGPTISGFMTNVGAGDIYRMHINGMSANEIRGSLRGNSQENINRAILASGLSLNKLSGSITDQDKDSFVRIFGKGESAADIARKSRRTVREVTDAAEKYKAVLLNNESPVNKAFRKAIKNDKKLSGAEKEVLTRRLNGASIEDAASFMGLSADKYPSIEAKLLSGVRARRASDIKSAGQWSDNINSLMIDQEIYMRYVHDGRSHKHIADSFGMNEKMVSNIVKRYARWRDKNAPVETSALRNAFIVHGKNLTSAEAQLMRRVIDGESVYSFAKRTQTPKSSAVRMYNSAMRKMHFASGASPSTRTFNANVYKAMPEHWMRPIMPAEIDNVGISGAMGSNTPNKNTAKIANKANQRLRGYVLSPISDLRARALEIREEMRGRINEIPEAAMIGHPVLGGHDGVEKMNALGAYISRTIEDAALNGVLDAIKKAGNKFISGSEKDAAAEAAVNKARKKLSEELWMKRDMMELVQSIHNMMDSASWPWMQWDKDNPEWKRHKDVIATMDMFDISTKTGRQKYIDAGFYLPLTRRETEAFIGKVYENNGIVGRMASPSPRRWAQMRDLYSILGVAPNATDEELKKAYRKKSRELHPDLHPNDPSKTTQFQELGEAWETLGNSRYRSQYDDWKQGGGSSRRVSEPANATEDEDAFTSGDRYTSREGEDPLNNADLMTDQNGRVWPRHNPRIHDWPTAPFTDSTIFPQRPMTEEESDEWLDWTYSRIQPSRPAGSALWGWAQRGRQGTYAEPDDDTDGGEFGGPGGSGPFPGPPPTPGSDASQPWWQHMFDRIKRELGPDATYDDIAREIERRIREASPFTNDDYDDPRYGGAWDYTGGSISGKMSNSLPPLDDSVQKRLNLQNLPSSYDNKQLVAPYPTPTINAYMPKPGEPSVKVTTTFGGTAEISQYRYDRVYKPILDALLGAVQQPSRRGKKRFVSVGGPAGSGKTTDRKTGAHGIPMPQFSLHVDADEIKTLLPEARALHAAGNPQWANAVHEESRIIADLALQEAILQGLDVVYDSTGQYNSGFETLKAARSAGYDIVMHYNTALPDALDANIQMRSATDPRSLPSHFNAAVMDRNYKIMPAVAKSADEFYLWDSTDIGSRRLLVQKRGNNSPIEIMHEDAYVYGEFDETGQNIQRGGRPNARVPRMRVPSGGPESQIIERFDSGESIEDISASMPNVPKNKIFDAVVHGYVDPNWTYRPPAPNVSPASQAPKKADVFVEDDELANTWEALNDNDKQIVKDVLAKKPNAFDKFEEAGLPMDIIIWAAQNGISGSMKNPAGISGRITQPAEGWDDFNWARRDIKNAPTYRGKPWRDVVPTLDGMPWPFETQKRQYPPTGEPGLSYFRGEFPNRPREWVDCLLWRDENGELVGILNHYPVDMELEKKGNINIFISPKAKRQGIASALVSEAIKRYKVDLRQQRYSEEGAKFINEFVRRLPENNKGEIAGNMATSYDKLRYSKADVDNAIVDIYKRGLPINTSLDMLSSEYGISMGRGDWSNRLARMRKRGLIDTVRKPDKTSSVKKLQKTKAARFIEKRNARILQIARSNPSLTGAEIAKMVSSMPMPAGVSLPRINSSGVLALLRNNGLGKRRSSK